MKTSVLTVIICLGAAALWSGCKQETPSAPNPPGGTTNAPAGGTTNAASGTNVLSNEKDRVSYAIGMMIGHNLQQQGLNIAPDLAARAIKDVQSGGTTLLTPQEATQTIRMYQTELAAQRKAGGEAFLATNKNKPGVVTFPDGLQYKVLSAGTGATPTNNDLVTVNYRGTLVDGTEFDSSYKRGQPAQFPVNHVIRGWTEALTHMNVGSKWQLFIPSELAYGEQGRPGIPPDSVLIFEVELVSVESQPPPKPAEPLTSDIIKVPSAEDLKKGAKIEYIKPDDVKKMQQQ